MIFRFDDVCLNTNMEHLNDLAGKLRRCVQNAHIQYAVSLLSNDVQELSPPFDEYVFQPIYKAHSAHHIFYRVDQYGLPEGIPSWVQIASHGIVHVDHQKIGRAAQEMSILLSCSLLNTAVFAPPFNKWDDDTLEICMQHGIQLQRFEDGWRSMEYNQYDPKVNLWYCHSRSISAGQLERWLNQ